MMVGESAVIDRYGYINFPRCHIIFYRALSYAKHFNFEAFKLFFILILFEYAFKQ